MLAEIIKKAKNFLLAEMQKGCPDPDTVKEIKAIIEKNNKKILPSTPLDELRFVVMDLETTGFSVDNGDEIIAVGALTVEDGRIKSEQNFQQLIYPYRLVPGEVVELTGIGREMLVGCPGFFGVLPQLLNFIGDSIIVGHYVHFDLGFINDKLAKCCRIKIKNRALDTSILARALYPTWESYSLDSLLAFYEIEPVGRHSAMGDAFLTAQLFVNLLAKLKEQNVFTLAGLDKSLKNKLQYYARNYL